MSARKSKEIKMSKEARPYEAFRGVATPRPRKMARSPRVRLTHLEVRRGDVLRLRIAIADDALDELGDELGALIKKIAPSTKTSVEPPIVTSAPQVLGVTVTDFLISRQHADDDDTYHANLRDHLTEFFSSLCDTALVDALAIAREERNRRAEGGN